MKHAGRKQLRFIFSGNSWQPATPVTSVLLIPDPPAPEHQSLVSNQLRGGLNLQLDAAFLSSAHISQRVDGFHSNGLQVKIFSNLPLYHLTLDLTQLDPDLAQLQPTDSLQRMVLEHVCPDSPATRLASLHANPFLPQRVGRMSRRELPLNGWPP